MTGYFPLSWGEATETFIKPPMWAKRSSTSPHAAPKAYAFHSFPHVCS